MRSVGSTLAPVLSGHIRQVLRKCGIRSSSSRLREGNARLLPTTPFRRFHTGQPALNIRCIINQYLPFAGYQTGPTHATPNRGVLDTSFPSGTIASMKYVIVIPDGCADEPVPELGNLTPLQAAKIPNMDRVAKAGVVGLSNNVPPTLTPASDVATLSLFGYDPLKFYTGRAPLETAAMGIHLGPSDWAIAATRECPRRPHARLHRRAHFQERQGTHSLAKKELGGKELGGVLKLPAACSIATSCHAMVALTLHVRNPLAEQADGSARRTKTQAHDIPDKRSRLLPQGPGANCSQLMEASKSILAEQPTNKRQVAEGKKARDSGVRGQEAPEWTLPRNLRPKRARYIGGRSRSRRVLLSWHRIDVPGRPDT